MTGADAGAPEWAFGAALGEAAARLGGAAGLEEAIYVWAAAFLRISAFLFLAPGLGERPVPGRVRLAAAFAIAFLLVPALGARGLPGALAPGLAAEAVNGLLMGFALRLLVFTLTVVGAIVAQTTSLSQIFGASVGFESESPFSTILVYAGVALALAADFHLHAVGTLIASYDVLPLGVFPGAGEAAEWAATRAAASFAAAFALATPFLALGVVYSLVLAAASRAMPQLSAAFVGAPAVTLAGLALFAIAAPVMLSRWLSTVRRLLVDPLTGPM